MCSGPCVRMGRVRSGSLAADLHGDAHLAGIQGAGRVGFSGYLGVGQVSKNRAVASGSWLRRCRWSNWNGPMGNRLAESRPRSTPVLARVPVLAREPCLRAGRSLRTVGRDRVKDRIAGQPCRAGGWIDRMSGNSTPLLSVRGVTVRFGGVVALDDVYVRRHARADRRADRSQWGGQDDVVQLPQPALRAQRRGNPVRGPVGAVGAAA